MLEEKRPSLEQLAKRSPDPLLIPAHTSPAPQHTSSWPCHCHNTVGERGIRSGRLVLMDIHNLPYTQIFVIWSSELLLSNSTLLLMQNTFTLLVEKVRRQYKYIVRINLYIDLTFLRVCLCVVTQLFKSIR